MSFRFLPRSAVYGQTTEDGGMPSRAVQAQSMPAARAMHINAGMPAPRVRAGAMPDAHAVELLKGEIVRLRADRDRIVKEANAKLGALAAEVQKSRARNAQLEGFIRTGYAPGVQQPGHGQVDVGVPTHALRNPYLYTVDGSKGAPPAVADPIRAGNPRDAAGPPHDAAHDVHETVRAAEDAIFYGSGDAAFFEGEGD